MRGHCCLTILLALVTVSSVSSKYVTSSPSFDLDELNVNICPCNYENNCTEAFNIPTFQNQEDDDWFLVNSEAINTNIMELDCDDETEEESLREGTFALVSNGNLLHVPSSLVFQKDKFCIEKKYERYGNSDELRLGAKVCLKRPSLPICCPMGEIMNIENGSPFCQPESNVPTLKPRVEFDGDFHDWSMVGKRQPFPKCETQITFMPLHNDRNSRSLQVSDDGLQFFWSTSQFGDTIFVDQPNFCVGQITSYQSISPAVAFCKENYDVDKLCKNSTCFTKCCREEYVFDLTTNSCEMDDFFNTWKPHDVDNYSIFYGPPACQSYFPISATNENDSFELFDNGSLWIQSHGRAVSSPNYCVDYFRNQTHLVEIALVCFDDTGAQNEFPDISELPYVILLFLSSAFLLIATAIFLYKVISSKKLESQQSSEVHQPLNKENSDVDKTDVQTCVNVGHFHSLACEMMVYTALQVLIVAVQQTSVNSISGTACGVLAMMADMMGLIAGATICSLCFVYINDSSGTSDTSSDATLQQEYTKSVVKVLWHVLPILLGIVIVVPVHLSMLPLPTECIIAVSMTGPWSAFPLTITRAILLIVSICLLFKDQIIRKEQIQRLSEEMKYRWWLSAKVVAIQSLHFISYISVWETGAPAFWVFGDLALILKSILVSASLLRHHSKCHKSTDHPAS